MIDIPKCDRCGVCCISAPFCGFNENEIEPCPHLEVHEDMTTSCMNKDANAYYIGSGCALKRIGYEIWLSNWEMYPINEIKRDIWRESCLK